MRREWELEDLLDCWTLDEQELALLANKSGATRLGFGLMLKYFELEARFPRREDIPRAAVEFMAGQVKMDAALFAFYDFTSRTAVNHRTQIREYHKFEEPTVGDEDKLVVWLASDICPTEISRDRLRTALLTRCREVKIEPPTPGRIERLLGAAEPSRTNARRRPPPRQGRRGRAPVGSPWTGTGSAALRRAGSARGGPVCRAGRRRPRRSRCVHAMRRSQAAPARPGRRPSSPRTELSAARSGPPLRARTPAIRTPSV
jgi:uncharacterized protein DUF4158